MTGAGPDDPREPELDAEPWDEPSAEPDLLLLSARLRLATRAAQDAADDAASFSRLAPMRLDALADDATPAQQRHHTRALAEYRDVYRRFLLATFAFESSVLASLRESPVDAAARAQAAHPLEDPSAPALLRADLIAAFGEPVARRAVRMPALPAIRTLPEWAGTEYVRLAAREGAAGVADAVAHNLGFTREHGASYLGWVVLESQPQPQLERFGERIDPLGFAPSDAEQAVAAARRAFEGLATWRRMFDSMTR